MVKIIFFLFIFVPTFFFTGTKDPFFIKEPIAQSLIFIAFLFWIIAIVEQKHVFKRPPLLIPLTILLLAIVCSLKNAVHSNLVLQFLFWQSLLVLLYLVIAHIKTEKEMNLIFKGIVLSSLISGIYGAMQHFGHDFIPWSIQWGTRPGSTFGNPNFAAGWWVMVLPLFASKFMTEKNNNRWFYLALTFFTAFNLYWGRTRGAWIASAISFFVGITFWFILKRKISTILSSIFVSIFCILIGFLFISQTFNLKNPSIIERKFKWATAWKMIEDYPAFGVGAGNLKVNFALYQAAVRETPPFKNELAFRATSESNVHNEYFQIWAETGTVGLISFLLIFVCWFGYFIKNCKTITPEKLWQEIGVLSSVSAFLVFSLTNFPLHIVPNACLLFFLLALSGFREEKKKVVAPLQSTSSNHFLCMTAIVAFVFIFAKLIFPPLRADYFRRQAEILAAQNNFEKAVPLYQRAIELDFYRSERTAYDLGECYRKIGKIEEAIKAYEISVQLRNYGEIYNNIGNCYYLLGNKMKAARNWEIAIHLGIPDPSAQKQTESNLTTIKRLIGGIK